MRYFLWKQKNLKMLTLSSMVMGLMIGVRDSVEKRSAQSSSGSLQLRQIPGENPAAKLFYQHPQCYQTVTLFVHRALIVVAIVISSILSNKLCILFLTEFWNCISVSDFLLHIFYIVIIRLFGCNGVVDLIWLETGLTYSIFVHVRKNVIIKPDCKIFHYLIFNHFIRMH